MKRSQGTVLHLPVALRTILNNLFFQTQSERMPIYPEAVAHVIRPAFARPAKAQFHVCIGVARTLRTNSHFAAGRPWFRVPASAPVPGGILPVGAVSREVVSTMGPMCRSFLISLGRALFLGLVFSG